MIDLLKRDLDFFKTLGAEVIPTILAIKPYIDEMMEIPIIKTIAICGSISGAIYTLKRLPKIVDRTIRIISTWGRH